MDWPNGARFAFTIIDDTEGATVANMRPIYDLFDELGIRTTKTVWVYPSRNHFDGQSLSDPCYRDYILDLQERGFEIALHGVGSGPFTRSEIQRGLNRFREVLGSDPSIHVNHSSNPDNIYWGSSRFSRPFGKLIELLFGEKRRFFGHDSSSPHFWGDLCKERVRFIRNHVFNGIVTSKYDSHSPYQLSSKSQYSNYWFSSSDGHDVKDFNRLLSRENVDRLVQSGGYCIVYTHLASGFVGPDGCLDPAFEANMRYLASQPGWFVPASDLLQHLLSRQPAPVELQPWQVYQLDARWLGDRLVKAARRVRRRLVKRRGSRKPRMPEWVPTQRDAVPSQFVSAESARDQVQPSRAGRSQGRVSAGQ